MSKSDYGKTWISMESLAIVIEIFQVKTQAVNFNSLSIRSVDPTVGAKRFFSL